MLDQDRFVACMGPFTNRSHAIQRRDTNCGGEITIGPSARRSLLQLETQLNCRCCGMCKQLRRTLGPFHRRTIDSAYDFNLAALVDWTQFAKHPFNLFCMRCLREPEIYMCPSLRSHDVSQRSTANHTRIHRKALFAIGEASNFSELPRQFQHRTMAAPEIHSGMRSDTAHQDHVIAGALARRLISSVGTLARLQYKDRFA